MSSECANATKPILGYICMNQQSFEWQIALSTDPMQEDPPSEDEPDTMQEDLPGDEDMPDTQPEVIEPPHDPDNPALNTYEMVKARFELECFKVKNRKMYMTLNKGPDDFNMLHTPQLIYMYKDWKYWGVDKDGVPKKQCFITEWVEDINKKSVEKIVIDPRGTEPNVYNLWRGFHAAELPPVPDERVLELIQPITRHIDEVITSGVPEHTKFLHDYLANMVQRPWQKSQVALSLYGSQGCGKGIIFEFFRLKVLGTHCSYQTSRPENDLFGRFANGAVNRVCIQVDEVKSLHDHADQLKDFITNPTINYEKKGVDTIVVSNFANLILTSNNANALTVTADDRRFALFHCRSAHKGDVEYFNSLGAHLERPEVARAYYQYLMSLDLSEYPTSFQHKRPITEYYKEAQHNSIPVISRFFSALVNSEPTERTFPCRQLYKSYETFQIAGNYKYLMTETAFGRDAKKIQGVSVKKTSSVRLYILDLTAIKKHLEDIKEYDLDAVM
jgi:hypothetical protein